MLDLCCFPFRFAGPLYQVIVDLHFSFQLRQTVRDQGAGPADGEVRARQRAGQGQRRDTVKSLLTISNIESIMRP